MRVKKKKKTDCQWFITLDEAGEKVFSHKRQECAAVPRRARI